MKVIRWLLGCIITLVILLIIAVIVIPKVFDPNDYREQISSLVKDKTQRDLSIDGDLKLSVFPWLGVTTGKMTFSHPNHLSGDFGGGNMLEVDATNIRLKILPLLKSITKEQKDIQVDTIVLKQPNIEIITTKQGLTSLDGLSGDEQAPQEDEKTAAGAGLALIVQGVDIESGRLVWDDRQVGQRYELRELNVKTGNLLGSSLASLVTSGELLDSSTPDILQFDINGKANVNIDTLVAKAADLDLVIERGDLKSSLQIEAVSFAKDALIEINKITAKANMDNEEIGPLNVDSSIPSLVFDQKSQILQINDLSMQGDFQSRPIVVSGQTLKVNLSNQTASLAALIADVDGITANVNDLSASNFIDDPNVKAVIDVKPFNALKMMNSFGVEFEPEQESALSSVGFSANMSGGTNAASLNNMRLTIDNSQLTGKLAIKNFENPNIAMDLALDSINLDNYVPKSDENEAIEAGDSADARGINALFALMPLFEQFKANGKLTIDDLIASGLKIKNIAVNVDSDADTTVIKPSAKLYDGSFDGEIRYERLNSGGRLKFAKTKIDSVQLAGLLSDAQISEQLSGKGSLNIDVVVEQQGQQQSSQGVIDIAVNDGAIKGIDIQKILRSVEKTYNQFKGREYEDSADETDTTKFSSLSGTFNLKDNVLTNKDFQMKAPLFRILGSGLVDLEQEQVDYTTNVNVVNSFEGQGGVGIEKLKGITIPIRFTGPMTSPKYRVDMKALAKSLFKDKIDEKKDEYLKRKLGIEGGSKKSSKSILKSVLSKKLNEKYGIPEDSATQQTEPSQAEPSTGDPSANDDLNSTSEPEQSGVSEEQPEKTKKERKKEAKDALKRKLLDKLLGG